MDIVLGIIAVFISKAVLGLFDLDYSVFFDDFNFKLLVVHVISYLVAIIVMNFVYKKARKILKLD